MKHSCFRIHYKENKIFFPNKGIDDKKDQSVSKEFVRWLVISFFLL